VFNNKGFSMLGGGQKMCVKCHDNTKAAQADNWNTVPSRLACGACHDGINFATGTGTTLAGETTGHVGKAIDDATCALCHGAAAQDLLHREPTAHNPTVPAGLKNIATNQVRSR
jgi:OmcA/MtrC family decaheme c-type cytochrome